MPGDSVSLQYMDSDQDMLPIVTFESSSIALKRSVEQSDVRDRAATRAEARRTNALHKTVRSEIQNMSDADLEKLLKK